MKQLLKKVCAICFFVIAGFSLLAQPFTEQDITGKWRVVTVILTKNLKTIESETGKQKDAFQKAVFRFDAGKYFTLTFDIDGDDPDIEKMEIRAAHWKLDSPGLIIIEEWKVKDSDKLDLMEIKLKRDGDKTYFIISDSLFKLEVQKMTENDD